MRLSGRYWLRFPGENAMTAHNRVTAAGVARVALAIGGGAFGGDVRIGLVRHGNRPETAGEIDALSDAVSTRFDATPTGVLTPARDLGVLHDGVVGGCFVLVEGELFSFARFMPRAVVQGDTVASQYELAFSNV